MQIHAFRFFILFLLFIELSLLSFWRNSAGPWLSPILLFIAFLGLGIVGVIASLQHLKISTKLKKPANLKIESLAIFAITGIFTALVVFYLAPIFGQYPINVHNPEYSDILPQATILVRRFLSAEFPYQVISEWGYDLFPTYLPLQWMPFIIAEIGHIDYRWIAFLILFLAILWYQLKILKSMLDTPFKIILSILPFGLWLVFIYNDPQIFGVSFEMLIAGYYLILAISIMTDSPIIKAFGITVCLLSRYSLILWLPLYFMILFLDNKKLAFRTGLYMLIGFLLIYGIPFLFRDPDIFIRGYSYHSAAALAEWNPSWQAAGEKPFQLFRGIGLAAWFYDFVTGSLENKLQILQITHLSLSGLSVIILYLIYYRCRSVINAKLFLLASLQIYLAIFYGLIQIPYSYLFLVPLFTSIPLIYFLMQIENLKL